MFSTPYHSRILHNPIAPTSGLIIRNFSPLSNLEGEEVISSSVGEAVMGFSVGMGSLLPSSFPGL